MVTTSSEESTEDWENIEDIENSETDEIFSGKLQKLKALLAAVIFSGSIFISGKYGTRILNINMDMISGPQKSYNEQMGILNYYPRTQEDYNYLIYKAQHANIFDSFSFYKGIIDESIIDKCVTKADWIEVCNIAYDELSEIDDRFRNNDEAGETILEYINKPEDIYRAEKEIENKREKERQIQFLNDEPRVREVYESQVEMIKRIRGRTNKPNKPNKPNESLSFDPFRDVTDKILEIEGGEKPKTDEERKERAIEILKKYINGKITTNTDTKGEREVGD